MAERASEARAIGPVVSTQAVSRKIIHTDMDAFYSSIEQRNSPERLADRGNVASSQRRAMRRANSAFTLRCHR
jgi:hypothetical protein